MINDRGSSLIEVLVSMVLLAIGLLGSVGFSRIGSQALSHGNQITKISALAQAKIEEKLSLSYIDLVSENTNSITQDGIQLSWKINHDDPFTDIATIEVVALWKDARGKEKRISFFGVKSNQVIPDGAMPWE
jgi:prepilin-type N-terminal cleavage/methylation domain-containing protein